MNRTRHAASLFLAVLYLTLSGPLGLIEDGSAAAANARLTPTGDGLELQYAGEGGTLFTSMIPIHTTGNIRYFSAGVGLEERTARYPAYPLKLMFVAGPKEYLTQVAVRIVDSKGKVRVEVPAEEVTGPWLFVDLPAGRYTITGKRSDGTEARTTVDLARGRMKTVTLRWPGELVPETSP